jgi:uncharacterized phage protein (TIGR02218 family)
MRTTSAALAAALTRPLGSLARLWRVERHDGAVIGLTDHDRDLVVEGTLYRARAGMVPGAVDARTGLGVDGLDVGGPLDDDAISAADIACGRFDDARVDFAIADWTAPEAGRLLLAAGRIGEISITGSRWRAELRGVSQRLQQGIGIAYGPDCTADFADARCGVTVAGTGFEVDGVIAVATATAIADPARTETAGWFDGGRLTILDGALAGLVADVATSTQGGIVLARPLPTAPPAGCGYRLRVGCDKRIATCAARFDNTVNFRGFPFTPDPGALEAE